MDRATVAQKLRTYITAELMNNPEYPLASDEPLISGGLITSFALAQVAVYVEEEFEIYIPDDDLSVENMDTLNAMVDRIMQEVG